MTQTPAQVRVFADLRHGDWWVERVSHCAAGFGSSILSSSG